MGYFAGNLTAPIGSWNPPIDLTVAMASADPPAPRCSHRNGLMSQKYDAIVIGGGHNGMICAAYLAKAGKKVVVLERRHLVGGATVTEEHYPGFRYTVASYVVSLMRPQIISDLQLPRFGFELLPLDGTLTPMQNGDHLMRWHNAGDTRLELMRHSVADAESYEAFAMLMYHLAMAVRPVMSFTPPDPTSLSPATLSSLAGLAKQFGKKADYLYDLAKLMTMSSAPSWARARPGRPT
jgi:phytoene dehydrogenase-like protein